MGLSLAAKAALVNLLFNNSNFANVGDATGLRGSTAAGNIWVSLHKDSPDETGGQGTNEADYGGYNRVALPRSSAGFTDSNNTSVNNQVITFPECTSGTNILTHFAIGVASSGNNTMLGYGALDSNVTISTGITPEFPVGIF